MKKVEPGYYKIKLKSDRWGHEYGNCKPNIVKRKDEPDDLYYTYTTHDYNSMGEEVFEIHIHEPKTCVGKIKNFILRLFHLY